MTEKKSWRDYQPPSLAQVAQSRKQEHEMFLLSQAVNMERMLRTMGTGCSIWLAPSDTEELVAKFSIPGADVKVEISGDQSRVIVTYPEVDTEATATSIDSTSKEDHASILAAIAAERDRQVTEGGYSASYDDEHEGGEIAWAAACYAATGRVLRWDPGTHEVDDAYPWGGEVPKGHGKDRVRDLIKAAALCIAEIERLQRAGAG